MATSFQTPGVYISESNAFPNSVVPVVATAMPAFIGYTQKTASAASQGQDLTMVATQINSLKQFEDYFGTSAFGPNTFGTTDFLAFAISKQASPPVSTPPAPLSLPAYPVVTFSDGSTWEAVPTTGALGLFYLYNAVQLFYLNGGNACYIISLGNYKSALTPPSPVTKSYTDALDALELKPDPTMVLCPDALQLKSADYYTVMQLVLLHCNKMQNRVSLMDMYNGAAFTAGMDPSASANSPIQLFRTGIGQNYLDYGIAYFPWVNTSLVDSASLNFLILDSATLGNLTAELNTPPTGSTQTVLMVPAWPATTPTEIFTEAGNLLKYFSGAAALPTNLTDITGNTLSLAQVQAQLMSTIASVNNAMITAFPDYSRLLDAIATYLNINPVASAIAGVITATDTNIGVWKAPANVSLNAVISPTVDLNDVLQDDMNVDAATGKSVNAIRTFRGLGTLVWGARTLAGNSQDWRYINVRRTIIFIEQSIKLAVSTYMFAPNTASTWANVKSMVSAFLYNIWKQGALAGATPGDAYSVQIGLGVTMTADDVLNGLMNLTVLVALVHPAEFIQLTFQQQLPKS